MRALPIVPVALLLIALAPSASAAIPDDPLEDHDHDGNMEVGPVCVWGWPDECVLQAYPCFQPYAPGFGINCI